MLEGPLRFTVVVEAELVNGCVVDGPGMANVPLLKSLVSYRSEAGHIRPGRFKLSKRRHEVMIVKVIVEAQVLTAADAVIEPECELVTPFRLNRCSHQFIGAVGWNRNILQQVNSSRIQASKGNDIFLARRQISEDAGMGPSVIRECGVVNAICERNARLAENILGAALPLLEGGCRR